MIQPTRAQQIGLLLMLAALAALAARPSARRSLMSRPTLVAIVGPTATGKSALGIALAHRFGGEVVSCDSTAVYRGFDIGTDKVPVADRQGIPHHMIDVADPLEEYLRGAVCARSVGGHSRHHRPRKTADPGRRHRASTTAR